MKIALKLLLLLLHLLSLVTYSSEDELEVGLGARDRVPALVSPVGSVVVVDGGGRHGLAERLEVAGQAFVAQGDLTPG